MPIHNSLQKRKIIKFNNYPSNNISDWSQFNGLSEDKFKVATMIGFVSIGFGFGKNGENVQVISIFSILTFCPLLHFNCLSVHYNVFQMTNFRLLQTERVCRPQFWIWWKWQKVLFWKHCGKRTNCSLPAISLFPTVFSKELYCRHVKTRACLGKG